MDSFLFLKLLHILGAAVLFGTGLGIAFFMFMADRRGDVALIAGTARIVVIADFLFTATAVVIQPMTGLGLVYLAGYSLAESWIVASICLYLIVGLFWLPVVRLQFEIGKMAADALRRSAPLSPRYRHFMRVWFWCGWPAFVSVLAIFYLMIAKPVLW